ncbi:MAG TPA: aminoglycoside phosphotransferase family protein [Candidatus Limnocylindria bacterium]
MLVDVTLVRELVDQTFPEFSSLRLEALQLSGSSNALFRLGEDLLVRLPRQPGGSATIQKEARWLPWIGPLLPTAVPEIVGLGEPGFGYPERWSVLRWLEGQVPAVPGPGAQVDPSREALGLDLAAVVRALGEIDVPSDALADPELSWYRGEPLATRDEQTRRSLHECREIAGLDLDVDACLDVWEHAMALPGSAEAVAPRWYHGDLLAENLLVRDGRLAALLDFGSLAVGDPTVDLIAAWEVLDSGAREVFRRAVGCDDETWLLGRAWALSLAVMTFPYYWDSMPLRCHSRLAIARSVLVDAA